MDISSLENFTPMDSESDRTVLLDISIKCDRHNFNEYYTGLKSKI